MAADQNFDFHHGGVSVPDLDAAIEWYREMLGFEVERRFSIPGAKAKVAMIRRDDLRFELFEVLDAKPLPEDRRYPDRDLQTHGNKHVAFRVGDAEAFLEHMTDKGADVAMVVREEFGTGFFIRDCAGNLVEFVEESAGQK